MSLDLNVFDFTINYVPTDKRGTSRIIGLIYKGIVEGDYDLSQMEALTASFEIQLGLSLTSDDYRWVKENVKILIAGRVPLPPAS